ncbi:MAG: hypothetical protein NC548_48675, partial [Lachnospiraceae bacterium]|nr:hypothetical protein [Lachnospiraceae bacterium]
AGYFAFEALEPSAAVHAFARNGAAMLQPLLIFAMLFLTFCKFDPRDVRLRRWHLWLLLTQCGLFAGISAILMAMPQSGMRIALEGALICLICPTATAAAVVTRKLGGDMAGITTYTILINMAVAVVVPALLPFVHPNPEITSLSASIMILSKVCPLLLMPLLLAWAVRFTLPRTLEKLNKAKDAPFYLWLVALALAIAVTTRSIMHTNVDLGAQMWLVAISLGCCIFQFWAGRKIGARYGEKITAGQALGQKNTVFAIWMGYTFFTPIASIAGGFYSIWHNVANSYQIYRYNKRQGQA